MKWSMWRYYWTFFRGLQFSLILGVSLSVGLSLVVLPIAYLLSRIFDQIIPAGNIPELVRTGALVIALSVGSAALMLWSRHRTLSITKTAVERLRDELLKRLYSLSRSYFSNADHGHLHSSIVHDTERVDYMSNLLFTQFFPAVIVAVSLSVALIALNWILFLVLIAVGPPLFFVSKFLQQRIDENVQDFRESFSRFSAGVLFVLQTMDLSRIQSAEQFELERQKQNLKQLRYTGHSMAWIYAAYSIIYVALANMSGFLVLIFGGIAIIRQAITLGELLCFYVVMNILKSNMQQISYAIPYMATGSQALAALYQFLSLDHGSPYQGTRRISFSGSIRFDDVGFQYDDKPLIKNVNLAIEPGGSVAILGPNGAGKSTIVNLILGFYRPQKGTIYADDHPYANLDLIDLRRFLGAVLQQSMVFPGTIFENITYGYPDAKPEQVIEASKLSTSHEFIDQLPEGYQTRTGEGGILLSGGQRQRLVLARALLRRPKLLILDEPTTHMDALSVEILMKNIKTLDPAPALLLVTHDPVLIKDVEHSFLMENGSLIPYVKQQAYSSSIDATS